MALADGPGGLSPHGHSRSSQITAVPDIPGTGGEAVLGPVAREGMLAASKRICLRPGAFQKVAQG